MKVPPELRALAKAARPLHYYDRGSERQVAAAVKWFETIDPLLSDSQKEDLFWFCNTADDNEMIDYSLALLRNVHRAFRPMKKK